MQAAVRALVPLFALGFVALGVNACGDKADDAVERVTEKFTPDSDGKPCGPAGSFVSTFVPERWTGLCGSELNRVKVAFSSSCVAHDACYDNKGAKQEECDVSFRENLKTQCANTYKAEGCGESLNACKSIANRYYEVVREKAGAAYSAAQAKAVATAEPTATAVP